MTYKEKFWLVLKGRVKPKKYCIGKNPTNEENIDKYYDFSNFERKDK